MNFYKSDLDLVESVAEQKRHEEREKISECSHRNVPKTLWSIHTMNTRITSLQLLCGKCSMEKQGSGRYHMTRA